MRRAPADGEFLAHLDLGVKVTARQKVATVAGLSVEAKLNGVLRGLIRSGSMVTRGLKVWGTWTPGGMSPI